MPVTISGTNGVTFNDSTTQSTAATAPTTAQVLSATAGASAGAVGTYALASTGTNVAFGGTLAGSSLRASGAVRYAGGPFGTYSFVSANEDSATLAGTWRCMGRGGGSAGSSVTGAFVSLWLRIS